MSDASDQHGLFSAGGWIMDQIRQYIISVVAAAIFCGLVTTLLGKQGSIAAMGKLLAGVFLTMTVVSPWFKLELGNWEQYLDALSSDGTTVAESGKTMAAEETAAIIKARVESYILDKATEMEVDLTVEVTLSDDDPPMPQSVRLNGNVSPYAKARLSDIIAKDLGIPAEEQLWN